MAVLLGVWSPKPCLGGGPQVLYRDLKYVGERASAFIGPAERLCHPAASKHWRYRSFPEMRDLALLMVPSHDVVRQESQSTYRAGCCILLPHGTYCTLSSNQIS